MYTFIKYDVYFFKDVMYLFTYNFFCGQDVAVDLCDTFLIRPTIKNCWFAVLLPTRQNWPYPKNFMAILRKIFFIFSKI